LRIIKRIEQRVSNDKYLNTEELNQILKEEIALLLTENNNDDAPGFDAILPAKPYVIMVVGVNGLVKPLPSANSLINSKRLEKKYGWALLILLGLLLSINLLLGRSVGFLLLTGNGLRSGQCSLRHPKFCNCQ